MIEEIPVKTSQSIGCNEHDHFLVGSMARALRIDMEKPEHAFPPHGATQLPFGDPEGSDRIIQGQTWRRKEASSHCVRRGPEPGREGVSPQCSCTYTVELLVWRMSRHDRIREQIETSPLSSDSLEEDADHVP